MKTFTLSLAQSGFTSEFGMGSGGPRLLWSPGKLTGWALSFGLGWILFGLLIFYFGWFAASIRYLTVAPRFAAQFKSK